MFVFLATFVAAQAPERVSSDTPRATPGGATFTLPAGWSIRTANSMVVLEPPETDTHVAIVDVRAADAASAVAAAWAAYLPGFKRPLQLASQVPGRNGWEESHVFNYETSPNERAMVQAAPRRAGAAWTVILLDGTEPTIEKRSAPLSLLTRSLRAKGYQRESFAGRKATRLDATRIAQMKEFVETSMQKLGIPGASIALVDNGNVVFEGGFGVRELGKPTPIDANTLFMAASNTKGMTTLLMAKVAERNGKRALVIRDGQHEYLFTEA